MAQKRQPLATKADLKKLATAKELKNLEKRMDAKFDKIDRKFEKIDAQFTKIDGKFEKIDAQFTKIDGKFEKIDAQFTKIDGKFEQLAADLTQHMNVVAENLVYDFKGIFKDRLEQHEDRITRLEKHTGLVQV